MATLYASGDIDGTGCYVRLVISYQSRTANTVSFSYTYTAGYTQEGWTQAGYETYTGDIYINGTNITANTTNFTVKKLSASWSGQGVHFTKTGTITVQTQSPLSLTANVRVRFWSSRDSAKLSDTGSVSIVSFGGLARIYTENAYSIAVPYVYKENGFQQAIPYVYTNGTWEIGT